MKPINLRFKGIGSYFGENEIDFSALDSIFLICGETGSGKTTILDAIMFALYGESSGGERESLRNGHYSKADGEAYAVFVFEISGRLYRFSRIYMPKARAAGYDISRNCEYYSEDEKMWLPFFDNPKKAEVNAKAAELLGLTAAQFRQVVILPQGKFERLLTSKSEEKEDILRTLFGADRFTMISDNLKKQADAEKRAVEEEKLKISAMLSASGFSDTTQADESVQNINAELVQLEPLYKSAKENMSAAKERYDAAAALSAEFDLLDKAAMELAAISSEREHYEQLSKKIIRLKKEREVMPYIIRLREAEQEYKLRENAFLSAEQVMNEIGQMYTAAAEEQKNHSKGETENQQLHEEMLRLKGLISVYENAEPLKIKAEKSLERGKEIRREHDNNSAALEKLRSDIAEKTKEAESISTDYESRIVSLYERMKELESAAELESEYKEKSVLLSNKDKEREKIRNKINELSEDKKSAAKEYENAYRLFMENIAAKLAADLSDGAPCPVCGSLHHPQKHSIEAELCKEPEHYARRLESITEELSRVTAEEKVIGRQCTELAEQCSLAEEKLAALGYSEKELTASREAYEKAQAEQRRASQLREDIRQMCLKRDELEKKHDRLSEELSEARAEYRENSAAYNTACMSMDKDIKDISQLRSRIALLENKTSAYEQRARELSEKVSELALSRTAAESRNESAKAEMKRSAENNENAKSEAEKNLAANDLPHLTEYRPDEEGVKNLSQLEREYSEYQLAAENAQKTYDKAAAALDGIERPDMTAINNEISKLEEQCRQLDYEIRSRKDKAAEISALIEKCRSLSAELEQRREISVRRSEFAALMSGAKGISFTRYALGVMLDMVTEEANRMLSGMLGGVFRLERKRELKANSKQGLDLIVENTLSGDSASYSASQLSGGEKFLISLVLGVSLSSVVQSRFGGKSIEAMFIDEGFGSLDPSALADAVDVIYGIRGSRRTVGIISHVEKLREEIPCCISVTKSRQGSRLIIEQ